MIAEVRQRGRKGYAECMRAFRQKRDIELLRLYYRCRFAVYAATRASTPDDERDGGAMMPRRPRVTKRVPTTR